MIVSKIDLRRWIVVVALIGLGSALPVARAFAQDGELDVSGEDFGAGGEPRTRSASERETAVRKIGIPIFSIAPGSRVRSDEAAAFTEAVLQQLSFKSYLQPLKMNKSLSIKETPSSLAREAANAGVDGLFAGVIADNMIYLQVVAGSSGRRLALVRVPIEGMPADAARKRQLAEQVVDQFLAAFPYRGFVTRVSRGEVEINLGSDHGMQPGYRMKVYEFTEPSKGFESGRETLGEIEVTEVKGPDRSEARIIGRGSVDPYAKIAFDEKPVASISETRAASRGWLFVGGEMLTVSTDTSAAKYEDKAYRMDATPFLSIGVGLDKFSLYAKFGQARNDEYDLTYTEVLAYWDFWIRNSGSWDLSASGGARVGHFNTATKRNAPSNISPTTSLSPALMLRAVYTPKGRVHLFTALELYYPGFNSGAPYSALPYSLGAGGTAGLRLDLATNFGLELGGRLKYFRIPVEGISGTQDKQASVYGGFLFRF